jgi:hypothetical protein
MEPKDKKEEEKEEIIKENEEKLHFVLEVQDSVVSSVANLGDK